MIRFANDKDIKQLKTLWMNSFHDEEAYLDFFFNKLPDWECVVLEKEGEIISMLFLLKCSLDSQEGRYIFAACTHPLYRGCGFMAQIIEYVKKYYKDICSFLCLVPAHNDLFHYYKRLGFKTYFYNTILNIENKTKNITVPVNLPYETFTSLRHQYPNVLQWGEQESQMVFQENLFIGGKNLKTPTGYAILRENKDVCQVIEWISSTYDKNELINLTKCNQIEVRMPYRGGEQKNPNGMILALNPAAENYFETIKNPYLSLVLD